MTRVTILGAGGRMGRTLIRCLVEGRVPELELGGAIDLWDCPALGQDAGRFAGVDEAGVAITSDLKAVLPSSDVVIDFTGHHGTAGNAPRVAEAGKGLVVGTTGLNREERDALEAAAKTIPVVFSPNMSLGVNLLLNLVEQAAAALMGRGYDVEIVERHHRLKKDAPSGTALGLGEAAARGLRRVLEDVACHGRSGHTGERPDEQIGFHAVRGGDIVGDHTVLFAGDGECIELHHRATSRDTFALGALTAARWLANRKPGLYGMRDVLGLS